MANNNPAHIVLTNVRLSYVHLCEPYSNNGGPAKFSATILVPKTPADNRSKIDLALRHAAAYARTHFGSAFPATPKNSVHDGDGTRPSDGQAFGEECRGCWVMTASNRQRPRVVDSNLQDILDSTQIYSGMYANVGLTFFGYSNPNGKGIGVSLDNVQKVADGEPLGAARPSAEDDFGSLTPPNSVPAQANSAPVSGSSVPQFSNPAQPTIDPLTGLPSLPDFEYPQANGVPIPF